MDPSDLAPLFTALQEDQYRVWWQAERTLLGLSDPEAIPSLLAGLAIPDCRVQAVVARVLGNLGDRRAVEPLAALLQTGECGDVRFNVRAEAAKALGQLGDVRAVEPLIAALADDDGAARAEALEALGRLGDPRAVEPLLAATRTWQPGSTRTEPPSWATSETGGQSSRCSPS
jgi:HEAT repeat protein